MLNILEIKNKFLKYSLFYFRRKRPAGKGLWLKSVQRISQRNFNLDDTMIPEVISAFLCSALIYAKKLEDYASFIFDTVSTVQFIKIAIIVQSSEA